MHAPESQDKERSAKDKKDNRKKGEKAEKRIEGANTKIEDGKKDKQKSQKIEVQAEFQSGGHKQEEKERKKGAKQKAEMGGENALKQGTEKEAKKSAGTKTQTTKNKEEGADKSVSKQIQIDSATTKGKGEKAVEEENQIQGHQQSRERRHDGRRRANRNKKKEPETAAQSSEGAQQEQGERGEEKLTKGEEQLQAKGEKGKEKRTKGGEGEKKRDALLYVRLLSASGVLPVDSTNSCDPYCIVELLNHEGHRIGKRMQTEVVYSTCNPSWGEDAVFKFKIDSGKVVSTKLNIEIWDKANETGSDVFIGSVSYSLEDFSRHRYTTVFKPQLQIAQELQTKKDAASFGTILNFSCLYISDGQDEEMDEWMLPRHKRRAGKEILVRAQELVANKQKETLDKKTLEQALKGSIKEVVQSQLVRVFVSSTFTDTEKERNLLMEDVYPFMQLLSKQLGMEFETVDMRWGVRDDTTMAHSTSTLCMSEIEKCVTKSLGPAFLCILGDKYGYRPFPAQIAKDTLDQMWLVLCQDLLNQPEHSASPIVAEMIARGIEGTQKWASENWQTIVPLAYIPLYFNLDCNMKEPHYVLGHRTDLGLADWGKWGPIFSGLQIVLRRAAKILSNKEQGKSAEDESGLQGEWRKFEISVTEEEVMNGILHNKHCAEQSICVLRQITDVSAIDVSVLRNYVDTHNSKQPELDTEAVNLLSLLKHEVQNILKNENIIKADVTSNEVNATEPNVSLTTEAGIKYRRNLSDTICKRLSDLLLIQFEHKAKITSALYDEIVRHISFREDKLKVYVERLDVQKFITDYISSDAQVPNKTLVIKAQSGAGKTALIAWTSRWATNNLTDSLVITRFLGTSPQSSNVLSLLQSLCLQLIELTKVYTPLSNKEGKGEEAEDVKRGENVSSETAGKEAHVIEGKSASQLTDLMKLLMQELSHTRLVIILDSLDQLLPAYGAHLLHWLPLMLPSHVRLVVSMLIPTCDSPSSDSSMNLGKQLNILTAGSLNEHTILDMGVGIAEEVLNQVLSASQRQIQDSQKDLILNAFKRSPTPLYLQVASTIALGWQSYTPLNACFVEDGIKGIINQVFAKLEKKHGEKFISKALSYLVESRYGLSNAEMEDILSCDEEVLKDIYEWWYPPVLRLAPLLWKRISEDLGNFMVERGVHGVTVQNLYHRQFREAAQARYVASPEKQQQIASHLAAFFNGDFSSPHIIPFTTKAGVVRTEDRLIAPQPIQYAPLQYNFRKLAELPFLQTKSGNFQSLASSLFNFEFIEAKSAAGMLDDLEEDYEIALQAVEKGDTKKEDALFAEQLQQFAIFIRQHQHLIQKSPKDVLMYALNQPDHLYVTKMANEQWKKNAVNSEKTIYQQVNKLQTVDPCTMTLVGHACCITPDRTKIVSALDDRTLKLWDAKNGRLILKFVGHTSSAIWCAASPDGSKIISGALDKTFRIWDIQTGAELCVIQKNFTPRYAAFTSDCSRLIYGGEGNLFAARISWEELSLEDTFKFEPGYMLSSVAISPDNKLVAFRSGEHAHVHSVDTGEFIYKWHEREAKSCIFVSNIRLVQEGHSGVLFWMDIPTKEEQEIGRLKKEKNQLYSLDLERKGYLHNFEHRAQITALGVYGNTLVAGQADGLLVVWDLAGDRAICSLQGHYKKIVNIKIDGKHIVSTAADFIMKVWDLEAALHHKFSWQYKSLLSREVIERAGEIYVATAEYHSDITSFCFKEWNMLGEPIAARFAPTIFIYDKDPKVTSDGKTWFIYSNSGAIDMFETHTKKYRRFSWNDKKDNYYVRATAVSPLGTRFVGEVPAHDENEIWDLTSNTCTHSYEIVKGEWFKFLDEHRLVWVAPLEEEDGKTKWTVEIIDLLADNNSLATGFLAAKEKKAICKGSAHTIAVIVDHQLRVWNDSLELLLNIRLGFGFYNFALSDHKIFFALPGGFVHHKDIRPHTKQNEKRKGRNKKENKKEGECLVVAGEIVAMAARNEWLVLELASHELVILKTF